MIFWLLALVCLCISIFLDKERFILGILFSVGCVICVLLPFIASFGYQEPVLAEEIQLVSLDNTVSSVGDGNLFYVSVTAENVYSYRYEVDNTTNLPGTMYETAIVSGDVKEIESTECEQPVLKVYASKPKGDFWFTFAKDKYTYVFYVPEGTIVKDVTLK